MTDLILLGTFLLCAVVGYAAVAKGRFFLERILFRNPELWYTVQEDETTCKKRRKRKRVSADRFAGNRVTGRTPESFRTGFRHEHETG